MRITGGEFYARELPQSLRFAPPYADQSPNPEGYAYWWKLFRYVFDLPDPNQFPPLPEFTQDEERKISRYLHCCEELAQSTALSHSSTLNLKWERDPESGFVTEEVTAEFPPRETIRGTSVLFRQILSQEEPASYNSIRKIIGRRIHECSDEYSALRSGIQAQWNRAHGQLRSYMLTFLANQKATGPKVEFDHVDHDVKPEELIKLFLYGDLIHWDRGAQELEALARDDVTFKLNVMNYLKVLAQLSHFYLGYSLIARRAISK